MIRLAVKEDIPEIMEAAPEFYGKTGSVVELDIPSLHKSLAMMIDSVTFDIHVSTGRGINGFIAVAYFPSIFNASHVVAQEMFWWVDVDARGSGVGQELLMAAESYAKSRGADSMVMTALVGSMPGRVGKMYNMSGYEVIEHNYEKRL